MTVVSIAIGIPHLQATRPGFWPSQTRMVPVPMGPVNEAFAHKFAGPNQYQKTVLAL